MFVVNGFFGIYLLGYLLYKKELGIYPLFLSVYLLIYVFVPYLASNEVLSEYASGGFVKVLDHFGSLDGYFFHANVLVLVGIFVIALMSIYTPKKTKRVSFLKKEILYTSSVVGILLGFVFFGVIVISEGGFLRLFSIANLLRAGEAHIETGFLLHFAKLVLPSSIVLFASIIDGHSSRYLLWFISLIVSVAILYILASRALFAIYFVSYIYTYVLKKEQVKVRYILISGAIGLLFVQYGEALFNLFIYEEAISRRSSKIVQGGVVYILLDTLKLFTFPYTNVLEAMRRVRGITDLHLLELPKAIINIMPGGTVGIPSLSTLSDYNTLIYNTEGEMPIDLLSFGYYSLGPLGVVLVISFYSSIFRYIDVKMSHFENYLSLSFHSVISCKLCFIAMYADLHQILSGNLYIIFFVLIVLVNYYIKTKR